LRPGATCTDHGMPAEPADPSGRIYADDVLAALNELRRYLEEQPFVFAAYAEDEVRDADGQLR